MQTTNIAVKAYFAENQSRAHLNATKKKRTTLSDNKLRNTPSLFRFISKSTARAVGQKPQIVCYAESVLWD